MGTIKQTFANNLTDTGKLSATGLDSNIPAANIADASVTNVTALPSALGDAIESVSTDPVSPSEGQLWYNTTIGVLKGYQLNAAAWASGGNMGTTRARLSLTAMGEVDSSLAFGGFNDTGAAPYKFSATEEYNGSSWTAGGNLNTARYWLSGCGTQTAGLGFGGYTLPSYTGATEEYNGTSWTTTNPLNTNRFQSGGAGVQTAGLAFGGAQYPGGNINNTEEYDGSSWTAVNALPTVRISSAGGGTQTAAIGVGGATTGSPAVTNTVVLYDGTNWTSGTNYPTTISQTNFAGIQTNGLAFGGAIAGPTNFQVATNTWNGSTWTSSSNKATATQQGGAGGNTNSASALGFGGFKSGSPAYFNGSEEFTGAFLSVKKVTTS
jgi:hypothetical protein